MRGTAEEMHIIEEYKKRREGAGKGGLKDKVRESGSRGIEKGK